MKISHNSFPYKGFSHLVSGAVEAVVLFGPSFDGAWFDAVAAPDGALSRKRHKAVNSAPRRQPRERLAGTVRLPRRDKEAARRMRMQIPLVVPFPDSASGRVPPGCSALRPAGCGALGAPAAMEASEARHCATSHEVSSFIVFTCLSWIFSFGVISSLLGDAHFFPTK